MDLHLRLRKLWISVGEVVVDVFQLLSKGVSLKNLFERYEFFSRLVIPSGIRFVTDRIAIFFLLHLYLLYVLSYCLAKFVASKFQVKGAKLIPAFPGFAAIKSKVGVFVTSLFVFHWMSGFAVGIPGLQGLCAWAVQLRPQINIKPQLKVAASESTHSMASSMKTEVDTDLSCFFTPENKMLKKAMKRTRRSSEVGSLLGELGQAALHRSEEFGSNSGRSSDAGSHTSGTFDESAEENDEHVEDEQHDESLAFVEQWLAQQQRREELAGEQQREISEHLLRIVARDVVKKSGAMQAGDGFNTHDAVNGMVAAPAAGLPAASRLHQYLGRNPGPSTFPSSPNRTTQLQVNVNAPPFIPKFAQMSMAEPHQQQHSHGSHGHPPNFVSRPWNQQPSASVVPSVPLEMQHTPPQQQPSRIFTPQHVESVGGTMYFYTPPAAEVGGTPEEDSQFGPEMIIPDGTTVVQTDGFFVYQGGSVPHVGKFRPKGAAGGNNQAQFMSQDLKMELLKRQMAINARADLNVYPDLPQQVDHMNNLVPLENVAIQLITQTTYKANSVRDGVVYCIRRIHGFRTQSPKQLQPLENWKKLVQGNVVQLREYISNCKAFGDNSLILVYDYHPLAVSLKARHFGQPTGTFLDSMSGAKITSSHQNSQIGQSGGVSESTLWSYVIQLSGALRAIHTSGLAARTIDLKKILIVDKKLLVSCCGIPDILSADHQHIQQLQIEDLHALGRVLVCLATGNVNGGRTDQLPQSLRFIQLHFSVDMKNLINYLLTPAPGTRRSVNDIMPMVGARYYLHVDYLQQRCDQLESEFAKELENGRLFRVLAKLNTITERGENNRDENWSETGDRFMIKLFRDYVFHQRTESGRPWLDMAHIVQCLNKLDAGVAEKIELVSRDGENLIIISYGDLKRCMETSFRDLCAANPHQRP